jgi:hypothetical protein
VIWGALMVNLFLFIFLAFVAEIGGAVVAGG